MDEKEVGFTSGSQANFNIVKSIAHNLFGEYELEAHHTIETGCENFLSGQGGPFCSIMFTFHRALSMYAMVRKNRKARKYLKQAKRLRKELSLLLKKGNPNVAHY
eukprot:14961068-Ditylum_brightwellii.AAC.1